MQDPAAKGRGDSGIVEMIDELDELLENDWKVPWLNRALWVDVDEFFALTHRIRMALPQEIRRAERFVKDSDRLLAEAETHRQRILQEARKEGERLIAEARQKEAQLTDQNEITRAATARAREIMQEAEQHALEIKKGADDYAREVLENLDEYIARVIGSIRKGREKLGTR